MKNNVKRTYFQRGEEKKIVKEKNLGGEAEKSAGMVEEGKVRVD